MAEPSRTPKRSTEEARAKLRSAALRAFARGGYRGTTLQQIASAAGMSKQLLLYYYPSKEALRSATVETIEDAFAAMLPKVVAAVGATAEDDAAAIDDLAASLELHADAARFVLLELVNDRGPLAASMEGDLHPVLVVASENLRQRQLAGHVRDDVDPEALIAEVGVLFLATVALLHLHQEAWPAGVSGKEWKRRRLREALHMVRSRLAAR